MQTGFITFETVQYDDAIPAAAEFGFDYVEIMLPYIADDDRLGREYVDDHADRIRAECDEAGIDLLVHLPHAIDVGAPAERLREAGVAELAANLRAAANVGAKKAVVHPTASARSRVWDDETVREWVLDSIRDLDGVASDLGIDLCLENVPGTPFTIDEFEGVFAETDCSMTLDTGHARISGYEATDIAAFLDEHADRVSHVHVNDNKAFVVGEDATPDDDHVPTGSGDLSFGRTLEPLVTGDWGGTCSLEIQTQNLSFVEFSKQQFDAQIDAAREGEV